MAAVSQEESEMAIVVIAADGTLRAMYNDELTESLSMGTLRIRRASHVEFDNAVQAWFVHMRADASEGIEAFRVGPFPKRCKALVWEVAYLEARLTGKSHTDACLEAIQLPSLTAMQLDQAIGKHLTRKGDFHVPNH
jgi:hypothetical protein